MNVIKWNLNRGLRIVESSLQSLITKSGSLAIFKVLYAFSEIESFINHLTHVSIGNLLRVYLSQQNYYAWRTVNVERTKYYNENEEQKRELWMYPVQYCIYLYSVYAYSLIVDKLYY